MTKYQLGTDDILQMINIIKYQISLILYYILYDIGQEMFLLLDILGIIITAMIFLNFYYLFLNELPYYQANSFHYSNTTNFP